jgi:hypothetical protein
MGAFGTGSFGNDDALDFVIRLEREGETAIRAALEDVTGLGAGDYLEAPEASSAIACSVDGGAVHRPNRKRDAELLPRELNPCLAGYEWKVIVVRHCFLAAKNCARLADVGRETL